MDMTATELAKRLDARKSGESWMARCPAHDDKTPSLAIKEGKNGRVLLKCWAGCELASVTQALNIRIKDLFNDDMTEDQFVALCKGEFNAKISASNQGGADYGGRAEWPALLGALSPKQRESVAKWRGYSQDLVEWLHEHELIGHHKGNIAFPVQNGIHYRIKPLNGDKAQWRFTDGAKPTLFVLGEIEEGAPVHCFESQWDALAYADASGERSNIVATRGASNVKLLADRLRGHSGALYLWPQRDAPGEKWARDIAAELVGQQIKLVSLGVGHPIGHKDLNEWIKGGATPDLVFNAYRNAQDFPVELGREAASKPPPSSASTKAGGEATLGDGAAQPSASSPPAEEAGVPFDSVIPAVSVASSPSQSVASSAKPAPLALSFPSLSQEYASGPPPVPSGPPIKSLPSISNAAGGLFGLWVVMGEPGIGKSALVRQIACSASRHYDAILDYDYENGPGVIVSRLAAALGDGPGGWHYATRNWYARTSITTLKEDISELNGRKAMVIVDSLQSLPNSIEFAAESLSKWMQIFEQLARDGHCVVIISEKNRANYGHGGLAAGKGSGAIEYKAWFGLNLIGQASDDGSSPIECDIFKNRHRPKKGRVCWIERNASGFWFAEWSQHGASES